MARDDQREAVIIAVRLLLLLLKNGHLTRDIRMYIYVNPFPLSGKSALGTN